MVLRNLIYFPIIIGINHNHPFDKLMNTFNIRKIQLLSEHSINRIAAGEVIERPASAVKELVENSIDAGATHIEVTYGQGGKALIKVVDDGHGIPQEELLLAIQRHATSKITDLNIDDINTLGFRGEALPSMGAAGQLSITSRFHHSDSAYCVTVQAGKISPVKPAALGQGTMIELTHLFHSTPARLKFLKSDQAEARAITDIVRSLALAAPHISFSLYEKSGANDRRKVFSLTESGQESFLSKERLNRLVDSKFTENSFMIEGEINDAKIQGYCSYPTYHRGSASALFFFVNNRPVRDKLLIGALRGAYADVIPKQKYPLAVLYINYPPQLVDVNVHPSKTEVRFKNPALIRTLIIQTIKEKLTEVGYVSAPIISTQFLDKLNRDTPTSSESSSRPDSETQVPKTSGQSHLIDDFKPSQNMFQSDVDHHIAQLQDQEVNYPMGVAFVQLHKNYIVSQTTNGFIIVDQHAAHERIVYERLKQHWSEKKPETLSCLVPQVIELTNSEVEILLEIASELKELGLVIEPFGNDAICIREIPAILNNTPTEPLIRDLLDGLEEGKGIDLIDEKMNEVISRISCHGSIRSGRVLTVKEMNELLREMEKTPLSGQCNHGRPTYVEFKLNDIESLFGRK